MDFLRKLIQSIKKTPGTGANIDDRTDQEKEGDYHFREIVATANPVNWTEKKPNEWRKFPIYNQNGSGSCVAQTMAKILGILYWLKNNDYVHFSATHLYQRRSNKPAGGMGGVDVFSVAKQGVTLEELVPSQNMTDAQMDAVKIDQYKADVGSVFKIGNFVQLPIGDIETVASTIQTTGKAVMVWFFWNQNEWTEHPVIKDPNLTAGTAQGRHSVTAVDFALVDGKKCLIIDDSWGSQYGVAGQRVIDETFFKARNFFAAYPIQFKFDETQPLTTKPKFTFTVVLRAWTTGTQIKNMQKCLQYEGVFPANVDCTGYYGAITVKAVAAFKSRYHLAGDGSVVDAEMIKKLNEIYG